MRKIANMIVDYVVQGFGYWFKKLIEPNFRLSERDTCVVLSWMIFLLSFQTSFVLASVTSSIWGYVLFAFIVFMLGVWRFWNYEVRDASIMAVIIIFELVFPPFFFDQLAWISILSFIFILAINWLKETAEEENERSKV